MKTYRNIIITLCAFIAVSSCREDKFIVYSGNSTIYFADSIYQKPYAAIDSLNFSFAIFPEITEYKEFDIKIPIAVIGFVSDQDREFNVVIDQAKTTATEGLHYKKLAPQYIRAGKSRDYVYITALRDVSLKDSIYKICLVLQSNDNFATDYTTTMEIENRDTLYKNRLICTLHISDIFTKPKHWSGTIEKYFLGEFSLRKLDLICELFFVDRDVLSQETSPSSATMSTWKAYMKVWLQQWKDNHNGEHYLDENGKPITLP